MKISEIIKNDQIVINTTTEEEAILLIRECIKSGVKWTFEDPSLGPTESNNRWHEWKKDTCYNPSTGYINSVQFYIDLGYAIIDFKAIDFENNLKKSEKIVKQLKASSPAIVKEAKKQFVKEAKRAKKNLDKMSEFANTLNTQIARLQLKLNYLNDIVDGMGWK